MASASDIRAGGAFVEIGGDLGPLDKILSLLDQKMGAFAGRMAGIGTALASAGAAIAGVLATGVQAAADSEDRQAQLAAVIKSTGGAAGVTADEITRMSSALQDVSRFEDDAITGAASLLLTFTKIGRGVMPQAVQTVLDMSQALGQDLKASSVQLGKALQDPIQGITALRRVGVNFDEQQRKMIEGMVRSGRLLDAQKMILHELAVEFGGSAAAGAKTFNGTMARLTNTIGDLWEAIGEPLLAPLKEFGERAIEAVKAVRSWIEANPQFITGLAKIAATLLGVGAAILGVLGVWFVALNPMVIGVTLLGAAILGILEAFGLVDTGLSELAESFRIEGISIKGWWEIFVLQMADLWADFKDAGFASLDWIAEKVTQVGGFIAKAWGSLMAGLGLISKEELADTFAALDQKAREIADQRARRGSARAGGRASRTDALKAGIDAVVEREHQRGGGETALAGGVEARPDLLLPGIPKISVSGFSGGLRASEQIARGGDVGRQQLGVQQNMLSALNQIARNTGEPQGATFA